jgi:hypothetical protein
MAAAPLTSKKRVIQRSTDWRDHGRKSRLHDMPETAEKKTGEEIIGTNPIITISKRSQFARSQSFSD